jgi:alkanesulfonate monooxygenase SsuD/methylene tetrahydromethanopterin reductase-like flavin-dependent oxidoreductase (luciferase family)
VQFIFFHLMPWTNITEYGKDWPVANKYFVPEQGTDFYRSYIDAMAYAEDCGFDLVGCNEHHFSPYGLMANPNLIAAALTQRTTRAKIAVFGNLVPLNNPIRIAEEYAMLDVMSGGRLVAGFMRGIPHEYVAYNVDPSESWGRLHEATQLIIKAWTEPEPFGWEGEYYQFPSISIWPKPYQKPFPQLLMSATNPEAADIAAKYRAIMGMVFVHDLGWGRSLAEGYRKAAWAHGWEPGPQHILVGEHIVIADSDEEALAIMKRGHDYLHRVLMRPQRDAQRLVIEKTRFFGEGSTGQLFQAKLATIKARTVEESIEAGSILCGSPQSVVKQMKKIHGEVGNGVFSLNFKVGDVPEGIVRHGMELFRDHVLPEMRAV